MRCGVLSCRRAPFEDFGYRGLGFFGLGFALGSRHAEAHHQVGQVESLIHQGKQDALTWLAILLEHAVHFFIAWPQHNTF